MIFIPLINVGIILPYIVLVASVEEALKRLKMVLDLSNEYGQEMNF